MLWKLSEGGLQAVLVQGLTSLNRAVQFGSQQDVNKAKFELEQYFKKSYGAAPAMAVHNHEIVIYVDKSDVSEWQDKLKDAPVRKGIPVSVKAINYRTCG